jgi:hypothetical protein
MELEEGEATVGRSRASTVAVADTSISRVHARLHLRFGRATVEDLGSSNGTYVNGIRLMAIAELAEGDRITVGETDLWVKVRAAESPEAVAAMEAPADLATRRIDPRRYLCVRCGRAFADDATQCEGCGEPRPVLPKLGDGPVRPESGPLGPFPPAQPAQPAQKVAPVETPEATRVARRWFRRG